jgi:hypothetical protein
MTEAGVSGHAAPQQVGRTHNTQGNIYAAAIQAMEVYTEVGRRNDLFGPVAGLASVVDWLLTLELV